MAKLTVILTHQLDQNRRYLELARRGLIGQSFADFNVLLVSGAESPLPEVPPTWRVHWDPALDTCTKKVHWALKNSDSEFIMMHSDDVFMAHNALGELVSACEEVPSIMNPMSNSDLGSHYLASIFLGRSQQPGEYKQLIPDMTYEDMEGWEEGVLNMPLGRRILLPVLVPAGRFLAFYCTMFPRAIWERVGEMDHALEYRHNDQDFCMRAYQLGIPSFVNLAPFAFHFGSKTLQHLATDEIKNQASLHFQNKWGTP